MWCCMVCFCGVGCVCGLLLVCNVKSYVCCAGLCMLLRVCVLFMMYRVVLYSLFVFVCRCVFE